MDEIPERKWAEWEENKEYINLSGQPNVLIFSRPL